MKKETKDSPWPFFQPAFFRHWTKRNMKPLPYYSALKKKERLSMWYLLGAVVTFHYTIYNCYFRIQEPSVDPESEDLRLLMSVSHTDDTKAKIITFDQFKLSSVEDFDQKEWEKAVEEKNKGL